MDGLLSFSAYAKQSGVSQQYISKLVKKGKLPVVNGKIDPVAADAARAAAKDPARAAVVEANELRKTAATGNGAPNGDYVLSPTTRATLIDRELSADLKRIQLRKAGDELVDRVPYDRANESAAAELRERLLSLAPALGPRLAAETDVRRCVEMLRAEVTAALNEFAAALTAPRG